MRLSQAKTLADLVAAALGVGRVSLAALGRRMARPTAAKHRIKRTWCFVANRRVEVSTAMAGVMTRLVKRRKKSLIVSLDWTEIRSFCTLVAAATLAGRAVPLKKADRIDRLLLIVTLAYILLVGLGRLARRKWPARYWCSNNRPNKCSDFAIGLALLDQARIQSTAAPGHHPESDRPSQRKVG